jgi:hypothetical protein
VAAAPAPAASSDGVLPEEGGGFDLETTRCEIMGDGMVAPSSSLRS